MSIPLLPVAELGEPVLDDTDGSRSVFLGFQRFYQHKPLAVSRDVVLRIDPSRGQIQQLDTACQQNPALYRQYRAELDGSWRGGDAE